MPREQVAYSVFIYRRVYGKFQERQGSEGDFAVSGWEIL